MPTRREEHYRLIQGQGDVGSKENLSDIDGFESDHKDGASLIRRLLAPAKISNGVMLILIMSAAINTLLAALLIMSRSYPKNGAQTGLDIEPSDLSPYAGLSYDTSVRFPYSTGYGPEVTNHSLLDERWEAIDINPGVVAITDEWASEHNLAPTQRFPWDPSKGIYLMTAFHTLHCLKNIHRLLYDAHHGRPLSRDIGHAMHCVDHLRKDTMCEADDFLLPSPKSRYGSAGPRGQSRVCKNWDSLVAWAGEHNACYQHISDDEAGFATGHDEIERYKNCPPTSPYFQAMKEHFKDTD